MAAVLPIAAVSAAVPYFCGRGSDRSAWPWSWLYRSIMAVAFVDQRSRGRDWMRFRDGGSHPSPWRWAWAYGVAATAAIEMKVVEARSHCPHCSNALIVHGMDELDSVVEHGAHSAVAVRCAISAYRLTNPCNPSGLSFNRQNGGRATNISPLLWLRLQRYAAGAALPVPRCERRHGRSESVSSSGLRAAHTNMTLLETQYTG